MNPMSQAPGLSRKFDLDSNIIIPGSSSSVELNLATDGDVVTAIVGNNAFPKRPEGKIELGHVAFSGDVKFKGDVAQLGSTAVGFGFSASASAGAGVYDDPRDALEALDLEETPELDLSLPDDSKTRFFLLQAGYNISGSLEASHPIGTFGTVTFGIEGKRDAIYALLHRFDEDRGAATVVEEAIGSWRLPRHVAASKDLAPGTWVLAEVDGSLALSLAAQLGYDFSYVHEVKVPGLDGGTGLTGDLGLKVETGLKVALGFSVSGRYLILVGRESDKNEEIRLRMFKLRKKGFTFGLNLSASVQGIDTLTPNSVDDLVKAVFGVNGQQVVKDLQAIEKWTDPNQKLSDLVAGLANEKGLELLRETTGIDPATAFNEARNAVLRVLRSWDSLPDTVSSKLWSLLGEIDNKGVKVFREGLTALAVEDANQRRQALIGLLSSVISDNAPIYQWLTALSDRGLLALTDQLDQVGGAARTTLAVLDGDVLRQLQQFIEDRLNLDRVRKVVNENDFNSLDSFLVNRLSIFLDEKLEFHNLDKIRGAVNHAVRLRQELYEKARKAITSKYDFNLAYNYQKASTKTALIDVVFDFTKPEARDCFRQVAAESKLDQVFVVKTDGVRINQAILTHEIDRRSTIQVSLPKFNFARESINTSLAKVTAVDDGERLLVYELDSKDIVQVRNRLRSQLSVALSLAIASQSKIRVHSRDSMTVSYRFVHAKENMRLAELKHLTQPFILKYLPEPFLQAGSPSLETWYADLDRAVEDAVGNGSNEFGDVLTSMEITVPGSALSAWLLPRSELQRKVLSKEISKRIQATLKELIPFYYFQELEKLQPNSSAAALLAWASMPPCTSVRLQGSSLVLNDPQKEDVFWNFPDLDLRSKMVTNTIATSNLNVSLSAAHDRLLASDQEGDRKRAKFFTADQVGKFQQMALAEDLGENLLRSLLFVESGIVNGAAEALKDVNEFMAEALKSPQKAIERLAEFGADITEAFHRNLSSVYGGESLRALGPAVFLEAARVLDASISNLRPNAMLGMTVLKEQRKFKLNDFLADKAPEEVDVALKQRLVSIAATA
jgi:hypothetical protein